MNVVLWIAAGILALVFITAGALKIVKPKSNRFGGTDPVVRAIGAAELAGGIGVVLPALTGIATTLTPLAASGLAIVMLGAIVTGQRLWRGFRGVLVPALLLLLALFVAWARFGPYAF